MRHMSIRWQLPLSYALIALLAALALGFMLISVLDSYYADQERAYLENNARTVSSVLEPSLISQDDLAGLRQRLETLAFFPQTRIQISDLSGSVIVDTGAPEAYMVEFAYETPDNLIVPETEWQIDLPDPSFNPEEFIIVDGVPMPGLPVPNTPPREPSRMASTMQRGGPMGRDSRLSLNLVPMDFETDGQGFVLPLRYSTFGFNLDTRPVVEQSLPRSDESVRVDLFNRESQQIGYVDVSEGPAVGTDIVAQVQQGWLIASGFAVVVAALAGWWMSLRITRPLTDLTRTSDRMAAGDLTARSTIERGDELGTLARAFNQMAGHIQTNFETLQRFVADAAHEIHTPITAVRANLELAAEQGDSDRIRQALAQVDSLKSLANDLLDLSRMEAGSGEALDEVVDLSATLRAISEIYASRAEQRDIFFDLKLPEQVPTIRGSQHQIERALGNLLDNATKFTPDGGTISVSLSEQDQHAIVSVADSGVGIPEDDLPHLFSRFKRGRNVPDYPGSGLGLAIVKTVIDAHGGTVDVQSGDDGTTFTVRLPVG